MERPQKRTSLVPIPADKLDDMLDQAIHLSWANPGCVWILKEIKEDQIYLETPKPKRTRRAKAQDACYVRRLEPVKPTIVRVFHNRNQLLVVDGDPDHCANLTFVATVTVPEGEKPLSAAFRLTNHIDSNWTTNAEVETEDSNHRSSSVGDVFEVCEPSESPVRYVLKDTGFSVV